MKKTKVAFYIESMVVGGAEKVLIDLVNHLNPEKYDITVIAIFSKSVYEGYQFEFDEHFKNHIKYRTCVDNSKRWKYILFNYLYANFSKQWIYRCLVREKYDIEVAFYEGLPTIFVANSTNVDSRKIAWLHTNQDRLYRDKSNEELHLMTEIYEKYQKLVGVSQAVRDSFCKFFPFAQVDYCYNILDENVIQKKALEPIDISIKKDQINLVTIGRMIEVKGYERLLAAIKSINDSKIHLWMIGDGSLSDDLKAFVQDNNLKKQVTFLGQQSNPYKYLKKMDYLVCSSYEEGLSTVVIEALMLGIPVITTDCSGMREIFGDKDCGIICENSQDGIENGIKSILKNNEQEKFYREQADKRGEFFYKTNRLDAIEVVLDESFG